MTLAEQLDCRQSAVIDLNSTTITNTNIKMPSLKALLFTVTAALTLPATLAAPTTTPASPLTKRAVYHSAGGGDDDYCGEANPQYSTTSTSPLAADCAGIYQNNPGPGYWAIAAAETTASTDDRWVRLAASGTCALEVRFRPSNNGGVPQDYRFGTNDARFYIQSHASASQSQNGRVSVWSPVYCRRLGYNDNAGMVFVDWRVTNA